MLEIFILPSCSHLFFQFWGIAPTDPSILKEILFLLIPDHGTMVLQTWQQYFELYGLYHLTRFGRKNIYIVDLPPSA